MIKKKQKKTRDKTVELTHQALREEHLVSPFSNNYHDTSDITNSKAILSHKHHRTNHPNIYRCYGSHGCCYGYHNRGVDCACVD